MWKRAKRAQQRCCHPTIGVILLAFLLMGATLALGAQTLRNEGGKGLYGAGKAFFFWTPGNQAVEYQCGTWGSSGFHVDHQVTWDESTSGGIGGCVFDSAIYGFYTTYSGKLRYVKVNASTGERIVHATTIASGISAHGAAAAVLGGRIYVFTASKTFYSADGTHFSAGFSPPEGADSILDAVTFFPPDNAPPLPDSKVLGAIMVLFTSGDKLQAEIFQGPDYGFSGSPETLSNPLSYPVAQGNCILGTSAGSSAYGLTAGSKDPCIQFYGTSEFQENGNFEYGRWEYDMKTGQWAAQKWFSGQDYYDDSPALSVAPWFEIIDSTSFTLHMQHLIWDLSDWDRKIPNDSDFEVPVYNDDPDYGWEGRHQDTVNAAPGSDLASLWTLVGVILGPPPFPENGATEFCSNPNERSWVEYANDSTTDVTTTSTSTSTISVASDTKIEGGIGEAELDLSYAHAWTSSHGKSTSRSVSKEYHFGPCSEYNPDNPGAEGIHGYAIFNAPTLVTQQYKLYAYDYKHSDGSGTYLGQAIYTTSTGRVYQKSAYFKLQDPSQGGPADLFTGMRTYPDSTNLMGWQDEVPQWDGGGSGAWTNVFQPSQVLNMPGGQTVYFSQSDSTIVSEGNSNSFSVEAGATLNIEGFSEGLKVGYDGEWSTETENESTVTTSVGCQIDVPIPPDGSPSGYVSQYSVQPFWLQAKTDKAPWIPTGYSGDLPWCTTWGVTDIQTVGGSRSGMAPPPALASGRIRHGGDKARDTFNIEGGTLSWLAPGGGLVPLGLTADDFDSSKGASIALNGHVFPADGSKGKWTRNGDVWNYKTRESVKNDPFKLVLDFASGTWSFDGSSKSLDQAIKASLGNVRADLIVEGLYRFTSRLHSNVDCTWNHKENTSAWLPYGVHLVKGEYDSSKGAGRLVLKGHIPKKTKKYGDVAILVNGVQVEIPLLSKEDFLQKLERGGIVRYATEGLTYEMDFGTAKWKLDLEGAQFTGEMAPREGLIQVRVLVGGVVTSDQTFELEKQSTHLSYNG